MRCELPDPRQRLDGYACRRVHGHVDGHHVGIPIDTALELLDGKITAADRAAGLLQQRRRFREPERLAAELIGIDQYDLHYIFL